jgi:hypothetical protein
MKTFGQFINGIYESYDPKELDKLRGFLLSGNLDFVKVALAMLDQAGQLREALEGIELKFIQRLKVFRASDIFEMEELFVDKQEFVYGESAELMEYLEPYTKYPMIRFLVKNYLNLSLSKGKFTVYKTIFTTYGKELILSNGGNTYYLDENYVTEKK